MCTLRPGVPGLSERIRVRSILGRFLEHSRIFRFGAGGDAEFWIGSADLMHRNLDRRVEALVRVTDATARQDLLSLLDTSLGDGVEAFELAADGSWHRLTDTAAHPRQELHALLLERVGGERGS